MGWGGVVCITLVTALGCHSTGMHHLSCVCTGIHQHGHHSHSILSLQEASIYQPGKLAIAAWSYCSGTDGGMLEGGRAVIARDDAAGGSWVHLARNEFPKHNVVGGGRVVYFPYHGVPVGGTTHLLEVEVRKAEVECLLELEYLLKDGLINSLLLELVQVTTGFILSASFLADLSSLFRRYNAKIVVDEVMTAGRTSQFLLYSTKCGFPADYITMGKWAMGGLVLRRDTTVGPWDGPVASMARQGALQYGQVGSSLGEISSSIANMAANLRSIMRMIEATGSKQLGKVVEMCRDRFVDHLVQMFPRKQLHFWGVGGMVYCNVAANRPTQLRSRFLLLITGREVRFDLTRVQGTSTRMGVLACSPYVDDTLLLNAQTTMREGLSWCGRLMTPDIHSTGSVYTHICVYTRSVYTHNSCVYTDLGCVYTQYMICVYTDPVYTHDLGYVYTQDLCIHIIHVYTHDSGLMCIHRICVYT